MNAKRPEDFFALLAAYAFGTARNQLSKRVVLVSVSVCFAVTLFDLGVRPFIFYVFEVRPSERFIYRWPPLPQLQRYQARVNFEGTTYGDLADISGRKDWRQERRIRFTTDEYGFRNDPADVAKDPLRNDRDEPEIPEELAPKLKGLGYVGGGAPSKP